MKKGNEKPWERQPGESGPAFEAFTTFKDLGEGRTVSEAARVLSKSRQLLVTWKKKWNWQNRADAWDASVAEEARKKAAKERKDMETRHIGLSMQLQKKALEALSMLEPDQMSPKDIKEFVKLASELERMSRHATMQDQEMELKREMFEYQKGKDSGINVEYEDMAEVEADIYGNDE